MHGLTAHSKLPLKVFSSFHQQISMKLSLSSFQEHTNMSDSSEPLTIKDLEKAVEEAERDLAKQKRILNQYKGQTREFEKEISDLEKKTKTILRKHAQLMNKSCELTNKKKKLMKQKRQAIKELKKTETNLCTSFGPPTKKRKIVLEV